MQSSNKLWISICISGMLAVIIGAFGAHALGDRLAESRLDIYETGVRYQFYHTLAALGCGILLEIKKRKNFKPAIYLFLVGNLLFSGSLYLLACRDLMSINTSIIGPLTPLGGLCYILAWGLMLWGLLKKDKIS